jgi:large subunit ribosomal protein L21
MQLKMLAVIKTGGKQYAVKEKQILRIEKLPAVSRSKNKVVFTDVLLVSDSKKTEVGRPIVPKAKVEATVLKDAKAKKVRVLKYKPKVRYRKLTGHRQPYTEIRIDRISV